MTRIESLNAQGQFSNREIHIFYCPFANVPYTARWGITVIVDGEFCPREPAAGFPTDGWSFDWRLERAFTHNSDQVELGTCFALPAGTKDSFERELRGELKAWIEEEICTALDRIYKPAEPINTNTDSEEDQ